MFGRKKVKPNEEEFMATIKVLQRDNKKLLAENNSVKESVVNLNSTISTTREEIEKLEACVSTLIMETEKSSAKIQELEEAKDASDKALHENVMQSLSIKDKELSEMQSQYNTEKRRLEDELYAFKKANEMLNEKLQKKEEENVRSSVQPRSNTPGGEASSAVFTPITCTESIWKYIVKARQCCSFANALDISKYNVVAVAEEDYSVYLYSETNKTEEKLCTCQYTVICLAWNQQGTLLAISGWHDDKTNKTIQVWDIPNRKITKRLKIKDNDRFCKCLDWKGDTITAGTDNYIYQWNISDEDNDQDTQGNKALLPRRTIRNMHDDYIGTVQWSNCKSKLATITRGGDMCIYDEEFKRTHHHKAHGFRWSSPFLHWCPWDNQVIVTCLGRHLKIWRVQRVITLIKKVKYESDFENIKWIPSKNAIITVHSNNHQLVLWEYPSLSIIRTIKGHTITPWYLALNADKSAMVSKSDKEMIFWKPFDQF